MNLVTSLSNNLAVHPTLVYIYDHIAALDSSASDSPIIFQRLTTQGRSVCIHPFVVGRVGQTQRDSVHSDIRRLHVQL